MNDQYRSAARVRGERVRTRADRPSQRRNAEDLGASRAAVCRTARPQIMRAAGADGGPLSFSGLACATDQPYEMWDWCGPYTESVAAGAFGSSLNRSDLDVPLVLQHVDLRRIARTTIPAGSVGHLALAETDEGLRTDAPELDPADADVAYITPKIASGLVNEMSFKFTITRGSWSPDWMSYTIQEVDIHRGDVAICGYGANPNTTAEILEDDLKRLLRESSDEQARRAMLALQSRFVEVPAARAVAAWADPFPSYRSAL